MTQSSSQQDKRRIPPLGSDFPRCRGDVQDDETSKIGNEDYSQQKEAGVFRRTEQTRDILSRGMAAVLILAFLSLAAILVSLVTHYVIPEESGWLSDAQLGDMKSLLFSGAVAGAVAGFVQRHTD